MSLTHLLDGITQDSFFKDYWETKVCHLTNRPVHHFSEVSESLSIDSLIWHSCSNWGDVSIARANTNYDTCNYAQQPPSIETINAAYKDNYTVVINDAQKKSCEVARYLRQIEKALFCRGNANIYVTRENSTGLSPHYDDDDVFILQVSGQKKWYIYDSIEELPLRDSEYRPVAEVPEVAYSLDLKTGDTLYIPRGIVHSAQCEEHASTHITISLKTITVLEILKKALVLSAEQDIALRKSVPVKSIKYGLCDIEEITKLRVDPFSRSKPFLKEALTECRAELLKNLPQIPGGRSYFNGVEKSVTECVYYKIPDDIMFSYEKAQDYLQLCLSSGILKFELKYADTIEMMMRGGAFGQEDCSPQLPQKERLQLIKHLLNYGFLIYEEANPNVLPLGHLTLGDCEDHPLRGR